jgi:hypothetical protein
MHRKDCRPRFKATAAHTIQILICVKLPAHTFKKPRAPEYSVAKSCLVPTGRIGPYLTHDEKQFQPSISHGAATRLLFSLPFRPLAAGVGAVVGCGGRKVDQQLFLRSSSSPVVMVKAPNDRKSNDPYPRAFSRSRDTLTVVVKVSGAITSPPAIIQDLPDALLGNAKHFGQCRYRLTVLVSRADFSVACTFVDRTIGDGRLRQKSAAIRDRHCERHRE